MSGVIRDHCGISDECLASRATGTSELRRLYPKVSFGFYPPVRGLPQRDDLWTHFPQTFLTFLKENHDVRD